MLPGSSRESGRARRSRVPCPICESVVEFSRMREHLRSSHAMGSTALEGAILQARKDAIRMSRAKRA